MSPSIESVVWMLLVAAMTVHCAPVNQNGDNMEPDPDIYLYKYGYMSGLKSVDNKASLTSAMKEFQKFFQLPETGELDPATQEVMSQPRCGVKDLRFATKSKWPKTSLTYKITDYTNDMPQDAVTAEIQRAFKAWSDVSKLKFSYIVPTAKTDIHIKFLTGNHGDGSSFDGPGGVLAHAFYPTNGMTHFDDAEKWTRYTRDGTNLFQVAVHEIGHALGLDHSGVKGSIMYPTYSGYIANAKLHSDDIKGIQSLYQAP